MKKFKLLVPIATVSVLAGTACTLASCACKVENKAIPEDMLLIQDVTLKGIKDGVDISSYEELDVPESVKIIEKSAFDDNGKADYSKIKTLKISRTVEEIREKAFAGLTNLETIDFSEFTLDDIYKLTLESNIFAIKSFCYIKLPEGLPDSVSALLKSKIQGAGLDESSFVKPTEDNVTFKDDKKEVTFDNINPAKQEAKLTKWVNEKNKIDIKIEKTGGTSEVNVKLVNEPVYEKNSLSYEVELIPQEGYSLKDGDYNEYKLTVIQKTVTETSDETKTDWVQIINNCKVTYKKPELYITSIEAKQAHPDKIYHQGDVINKDEIIVEALYNDRSRTVLEYGADGYSVEGYEDFRAGHTLTVADINKGSISFTIKYSKKGIGDFSTIITFSNIALKVEEITITGDSSIYRGTSKEYTVGFLPAGSSTTIEWSIVSPVEGVTLDNGQLTVANDVAPQTIQINVVDTTDPSIYKTVDVDIEIPPADKVIFTKTHSTCYRGSGQSEYKFQAKVNNEAALQGIAYSIKEDYSGVEEDKKVSINSTTGVVTIGKKVPYNTTVTVVATATDSSGKYAEATFKVDVPDPVISITSGATSTTLGGADETYTASVTPDGAEQTIKWSTSDTKIAIIGTKDGVLHTELTGKAGKVNVVCTNDPQEKTSTKQKTATKQVIVNYVDPTSVTINETAVTEIYRGKSQTFTATMNKGAYQKAYWYLNETPEGISINKATGALTVKPQATLPTSGYVNVYAKALKHNFSTGGDTETSVQSADKRIDILVPDPATVKITGSITPGLSIAKSFTFGATVYEADYISGDPACYQDVTWEVSNITPELQDKVHCDADTGKVSIDTFESTSSTNIVGSFDIVATSKHGSKPSSSALTIKVYKQFFEDTTLDNMLSYVKTYEEADKSTEEKEKAAADEFCSHFGDLWNDETGAYDLTKIEGKRKTIKTETSVAPAETHYDIVVKGLNHDVIVDSDGKKAMLSLQLIKYDTRNPTWINGPLGLSNFNFYTGSNDYSDSNLRTDAESKTPEWLKNNGFSGLANAVKKVYKSIFDGNNDTPGYFNIECSYFVQSRYEYDGTGNIKDGTPYAFFRTQSCMSRTAASTGKIWSLMSKPGEKAYWYEETVLGSSQRSWYPMFCI